MEDKYTSSSALQLAGEAAFIQWILEGEEAPRWEAWLAQHPDKQKDVEEARRLVNALAQSSPHTLSSADKKIMWDHIETHAKSATKPKVNRPVRTLGWWALAAAATLALFIWIRGFEGNSEYIANAAEQKEVVLPENSQVSLNAGSKISYSKQRFEKDRTLHLEGEGFFSVQHGSRFMVKTAYGDVTVLGTSFNVIARPDRFEVTCFTGKVKVENSAHSLQIITPGQRCETNVDNHSLELSTFSSEDQKPQWMSGKFVFQNETLRTVADELERQYDVKVNLQPGLENVRYTGLFESGDLDEALKLITWFRSLEYQKTDKTISIIR